jgi:hypothetical protein
LYFNWDFIRGAANVGGSVFLILRVKEYEIIIMMYNVIEVVYNSIFMFGDDIEGNKQSH